MSDVKISELPAVGTPAGSDEFPINQSGTTKKMTLAQLLASAQAGSFSTLAASGDVTVGGDATAADRAIEINTAAAQNRYVRLQSAGVDRWRIGADDSTESGSDAGSDLEILPRTDAGAEIGTALKITRADMAAVFGGTLRSVLLGVGAAPDAGKGLLVAVESLTGTTQIGGEMAPVFSSAATVAAYGLKALVETEAASFTLAEAAAILVPNAVKGSGSTITTLYGIKIEEPTQGATNVALHVAGGDTFLGGDVEIDGALNHDGSTYGLCGVAPSALQTGYTTFSNLTTVRTLDADSTTVDELADTLGTLIEDLKAKGVISA